MRWTRKNSLIKTSGTSDVTSENINKRLSAALLTEIIATLGNCPTISSFKQSNIRPYEGLFTSSCRCLYLLMLPTQPCNTKTDLASDYHNRWKQLKNGENCYEFRNTFFFFLTRLGTFAALPTHICSVWDIVAKFDFKICHQGNYNWILAADWNSVSVAIDVINYKFSLLAVTTDFST